jgi:hypothetical protein
VLRIGNLKMSKDALATALNCELSRYGTARDGSTFAQINIPDADDIWAAIAEFTAQKGATLLALQESRLLGQSIVDLAVMFGENFSAISVTAPSESLALLCRYGIDIQFSIYRADDSA